MPIRPRCCRRISSGTKRSRFGNRVKVVVKQPEQFAVGLPSPDDASLIETVTVPVADNGNVTVESKVELSIGYAVAVEVDKPLEGSVAFLADNTHLSQVAAPATWYGNVAIQSKRKGQLAARIAVEVE